MLELAASKAAFDCCRHLVDVSVQQEDDVKSGYRIALAFRPNPLFSNAELVKTLRYADDGELTMSATTVQWKEGVQS